MNAAKIQTAGAAQEGFFPFNIYEHLRSKSCAMWFSRPSFTLLWLSFLPTYQICRRRNLTSTDHIHLGRDVWLLGSSYTNHSTWRRDKVLHCWPRNYCHHNYQRLAGKVENFNIKGLKTFHNAKSSQIIILLCETSLVTSNELKYLFFLC